MKFLQKKWNIDFLILHGTESAKENIFSKSQDALKYSTKSLKVEKVTERARFLEEDSPVAAVVITRELLRAVWNQCSLYSAFSFFFKWPFVFDSWPHSLCFVLTLWRHLSFTRERLVVLFKKKKKQLEDEHNERNAEFKVLGRHGKNGECQPYTHNSHHWNTVAALHLWVVRAELKNHHLSLFFFFFFLSNSLCKGITLMWKPY